MAFWFAMDDANASNGCMWVAPGSHKSGITRRFALADDQKSCSFIPGVLAREHERFFCVIDVAKQSPKDSKFW